MKNKIMSEILQMSVSERIDLVDEIWQTIMEVPESFDISEEQKQEIRRRKEDFLINPTKSHSWEVAKSRILE